MSRFSQFLHKLEGYANLESFSSDGESYTYAQLSNEREAWSQRLASMSVAPGSVVGLRSDYSPTSIAVLLALLECRAVVALIPRDRDVSAYLDDARASLLLEIDPSGAVNTERRLPPPSHELLEKLCAGGDAGL